MIDTDKYEGHTPVREEWPRWCEDWLFNLYSGKTDDGSHTPTWNQDNTLACDAPLLLAEVKRLRKVLEDIRIDALVMMAEGVGVDAYSIMRRAEQVIRGEEE